MTPIRMRFFACAARLAPALAPGDVVKVGTARVGVRAYIAVAGGLDVPPVLDSRATYLRGGLGGLDGRALRSGDRLRAFREAGASELLVVPMGAPEERIRQLEALARANA
jgi:allophanate hydrolase subunit 2